MVAVMASSMVGQETLSSKTHDNLKITDPMKEDEGKMHRNSLVITCKAFTPDKTVKAIQIWTREKGRKSSV